MGGHGCLLCDTRRLILGFFAGFHAVRTFHTLIGVFHPKRAGKFGISVPDVLTLHHQNQTIINHFKTLLLWQTKKLLSEATCRMQM